MASLTHLVLKQLKNSPNKRFTARQLAQSLIETHREEFAAKRNNPRFKSDKDFTNQVVAEIGAQVKSLYAKDPHFHTRDKPRPRLYYWADESSNDDYSDNDESSNITDKKATNASNNQLSEHSLYPLLIDFLSVEHQLCCARVDEKTSINSRGSGANHWLHPDIVAMEPITYGWNETLRSCVNSGNMQLTRLWSFEVKKDLNKSNVRKCFFQAVSNSSWANYGYLVATSLADNIEAELQMLCALHGIGLILLDTDDPTQSQIQIPARERPNVDWQSVNRIVEQNKDFAEFIDNVDSYHKTHKIKPETWNK